MAIRVGILAKELNLLKIGTTAQWSLSYRIIITAIFAVLVSAIVLAALFVRSDAKDKSQSELDDVVEVAIDSIRSDLQESVSQIRAIQGFFHASNFVSREEFSIFVDPFLKDAGGIQALEWIPRVRASDKDEFVQRIREEGFGEFEIRPASESPDYFPVTYLAPFSGNTTALGFDLSSEETRETALLTAWESGKISVTEPITLVQESGSQLAFLVFAPVYSTKEVPQTLEDRKELLEGFALGVVRFGDFINNAIPSTFDPAISIRVVDIDGHSEIVLYTAGESDPSSENSDALNAAISIEVANEVWEFSFSAPNGYGLGWLDRFAWVLVLVIGILFSIVVFTVVLLLYKGRQAALRLSNERQESEGVQRALAEELTQLIESANNPIFGVDIDGRINIWNDVMEEITGASTEEAIGRPAIDYMVPDSREVAQEHLQSVLAEVPCGDLYLKFLGPDDDSAELIINCTLRRNVDGEISGILGVGLDITERLRAEEEIKWLALVNGSLSEIGQIFSSSLNTRDVWGPFTEATKLLLDFDRAAILSIDLDTGIVNRVHISGEPTPSRDTGSSYAIAGSMVENLVQSRTAVRYQGENVAEIISPYAATVSAYQGGMRSFIGVPLISNDQVIGAIVFSSSNPNNFSDSDIELASGIGTHIAGAFANGQLYQQINALNSSLENRVADRTKELQETLEELEAFSYSVSHDLRGPLRSINGFSQAVMRKYGDRLEEDGREQLERVRSATNRMGDLIDDLLELSRVGRAEMIPDSLDVGMMVRGKETELRNADPDRQVNFVISDDALGFGDERLIGIVVDNLVRNAWKFTSTHPTARIELGIQDQDGERVYFIKDDGVGFDMEYADKLFLPFQRLHPAGEFEGTGIGLATVRRIILRHGGRIWAEGEVEKGAVVYFTLGNGVSNEDG